MYRKSHYFTCVSLLISGLLLTSDSAFARGGRRSGGYSGGSVHVKSYTRKDGTHVSAHTRRAPHARSGAPYSSRVRGSSYNPPVSNYSPPVSNYSPPVSNYNPPTSSYNLSKPERTSPPDESNIVIPESESTSLRTENLDRGSTDNSTPKEDLTPEIVQPSLPDRSVESPPVKLAAQSNNNFYFPRSSCGDSSSPQNVWYPVFINHGNLEQVQAQFCHDAVSTIRQDSKVQAIQLASFSDRDRAAQFAQKVGGEVGEPTKPEDPQEKKQISKNSIPTKDNAQTRQEVVRAGNRGTQTATNASQSEEKSPNFMGIVTIGLALIGAGYWRGQKKAQSK
jgi:hypothetical protein